MSTLEVLNAIASKLDVTVEVDEEYCTAKNCGGACVKKGKNLTIKLASLEAGNTSEIRIYAHELMHAIQFRSGDYLWEEDDLEFWGLLEDVPLDAQYMNGFRPYWDAIVERKMYTASQRRWEYLPYYVQHASNGWQVFWRIAKTVIESR